MSFSSTVQKTVNEIKKIEDKTFSYSEKLYDKIPTKYILSLYRRCHTHVSANLWYLSEDKNHNSEMKIAINYLHNAEDRLKKILDKRENLK